MRVAINGFGRIGRSVFRILDALDDVDVVAINDLFDHNALRYLLKHDTVMGTYKKSLSFEDGHMITPTSRVKMLMGRDPSKLPWAELKVDVVIEATGVFRARSEINQHIEAGAKRVILTVPAKDDIDYTVVLGVNEDGLKPEHLLISNASCTTNCLAPMARVINEEFGIVEGLMNTVHAYTNDQRLADVPHSDWRRSRAAAENIIPTSTGAAKAVGVVLPELKGKLDGIAARVPVPDGSVVDLYVELARETTIEEVHSVLKKAAATPRLSGILQYMDKPVVSSDIIGNPHSSVFDAAFTKLTAGRYLKTLNWYDNEWGYSNRVCDVIRHLKQWS
ncbi:MAG: type I glyceraldehyde-3-phosphate dehydrogenase [Pseudomonadales bacterium]